MTRKKKADPSLPCVRVPCKSVLSRVHHGAIEAWQLVSLSADLVNGSLNEAGGSEMELRYCSRRRDTHPTTK